jgi:hypothetical protein
MRRNQFSYLYDQRNMASGRRFYIVLGIRMVSECPPVLDMLVFETRGYCGRAGNATIRSSEKGTRV